MVPHPASGRKVSFSSDPSLRLTATVADGIIADWDAAWGHIERALSGSKHPGAGSSGMAGRRLVVVDSILAPRSEREAWAAGAMERRGATGVCFVREPVAVW